MILLKTSAVKIPSKEMPELQAR